MDNISWITFQLICYLKYIKSNFWCTHIYTASCKWLQLHDGKTMIPSIARSQGHIKHLIWHIHTCMRSKKNLLKHKRKISDPRGKQFALFYILLRPGHLALLQLYVTLHRDVKMSSSILKSRVAKQTFVVNSW